MADIPVTFTSDPPMAFVQSTITKREVEGSGIQWLVRVPVRFDGNRAVNKEVRLFQIENGDGAGLGTTVTVGGVDYTITMDLVKAVHKAAHQIALGLVTAADLKGI